MRLEHALETFKRIPEAELAVIPDAGHFALFSEPERVTPIVKYFLKSPRGAMSEQLGHPLTVHHVGFTAWDSLDVLSVSKHHMKVRFEHVPDRLPVHAGRLHGNMPDVKPPELLSQLTQISRSATEAA